MTRTDPDVQRIAELYRETLDSVAALEKYARIGRLIDHAAVTPAHVHAPSRNSRTWLWSDLHLFHDEIIERCNRPFAGIHHMAGALLREAKRVPADGDTVLNGGDVSGPIGLFDPWRETLAEAPARKILVTGNHDFNRFTGCLDLSTHDLAVPVVVIDTDPPLAMTHVPLAEVPGDWVNGHGHVHNMKPLPGDSAHVNVCVEHLEYRPVKLERILALAKHVLRHGQPRGTTRIDRIRAAEETGTGTGWATELPAPKGRAPR